MNYSEMIRSRTKEFLDFMKSKFPMFDSSNVFLRDVQYAVMGYLGLQGIKLNLSRSEEVALEVIKELETQGIFIRIDAQSWRLQYPQFALPKPEKKV